MAHKISLTFNPRPLILSLSNSYLLLLNTKERKNNKKELVKLCATQWRADRMRVCQHCIRVSLRVVYHSEVPVGQYNSVKHIRHRTRESLFCIIYSATLQNCWCRMLKDAVKELTVQHLQISKCLQIIWCGRDPHAIGWKVTFLLLFFILCYFVVTSNWKKWNGCHSKQEWWWVCEKLLVEMQQMQQWISTRNKDDSSRYEICDNIRYWVRGIV